MRAQLRSASAAHRRRGASAPARSQQALVTRLERAAAAAAAVTGVTFAHPHYTTTHTHGTRLRGITRGYHARYLLTS